MNFRYIKTRENGDATSNYNIEGNFPIRFADFFKYILEDENSFRIEFGTTNDCFGGWLGKRLEIRKNNEDGKCYWTKEDEQWYSEIKDLPVVKCWANGGWGQMSYFVTFDEKALVEMKGGE